MIEKRRDNRNRILHQGEMQLPDGRYRYKYKDIGGTTRYEYSWRLDNSDRTPEGKKNGPSLREKERRIQRDVLDGVSSNGGNLTVYALAKKYLATKVGVKETTRAGYGTVMNFLKNDPMGARKISKLKTSDIKLWLIHLQQDLHKGYSTIKSIRGVLRPAFAMAVEDDLIRKNPFDFEMKTVVVNDSKKREAITEEEKKAFLDFVREDSHFSIYYEAFYVLFHTGLRISEFVGLTVSDIDFDTHSINVDHQLLRSSHMKYYIEKPKTPSGNRKIPMTDEVEKCLRIIIDKRPKAKKEPTVDGYSGFLYLDKNGRPVVAMHWEQRLRGILKKYTIHHDAPLPHITPHVLRHTFCTHVAMDGIHPKTLQYIMGHSDFAVTMNVYTDARFEDARKSVNFLNA